MQAERIKWDFQNIAYGPDASQRFDMVCGKKNVHAIVYIHGGAYFKGNRMEYPSFMTDYSRNNLIATIDYRVVKVDNDINMGDILCDVNDALIKITDLSNENGIKIKDFILIGHSAGGHIALLYGYKNFQKNKKIKIAACISMAGPADFTDDTGWSSMEMWGEDMGTRLAFLSWMGTRLTDYKKLTGNSIELTQNNWTKQRNYSEFKKYLEGISPVSYVPKMGRLPPTLLVHARGDDQVPYSNPVRLTRLLDETSTPHKLITPVGSANSHMLGGMVFEEHSPFIFNNQPWVNEAKEWVGACLKAGKTD